MIINKNENSMNNDFVSLDLLNIKLRYFLIE